MRDHDFRETGWAKINLALHVVGVRTDGYHDLQSLVVFSEFGDHLTASLADADRLTLSGPFANDLASTATSTNLVRGTLTKFRTHYPDFLPAGLHIHLEKNLPIAAGIGGGSADAAATLRLISRYTDNKVSPQQFADLALKIGADVPMCLAAKTSLVTGIGADISHLETMPPLYITLVNPREAVSTPAMFAALKQANNQCIPPLGSGFGTIAELTNWLGQTRNDLQVPAEKLVPEISQIIASLTEAKGTILTRMSGSGATVFGLYASRDDAQNALEKIKSENQAWWAVATKIR